MAVFQQKNVEIHQQLIASKPKNTSRFSPKLDYPSLEILGEGEKLVAYDGRHSLAMRKKLENF